ncbi:MAG: tetratricopeptide repeat protein [Sulfurovum sp.]
MYDVDIDEKVYAVTYKELIFTLVVFIIILVALYPKGILKDQISADNSNYDLSMAYLNDLLKHSPNDESLKLILLEKYVQAGEINSSLKLSDKLLRSDNEYIRTKAIPLAYEIKKRKYFSTEDKKVKRSLYMELQNLFHSIEKTKLYDEKKEKWYKEAVSLQNFPVVYRILKQLLQDDPDNIEYLKDAYYLSLKLHKQEDSVHYLNSLEKHDTLHSKEWVMKRYDYYIRFKDYKNAELLLRRYAKDSAEMQEKLASFYLMIQKYEEASDTYLKLYYASQNKLLQEHYLTKAIKTLQAGNLLKQAAQLTRQYESKYIHNVKMRKLFLRIYLAAGELDYAAELSKKILRYEDKL